MAPPVEAGYSRGTLADKIGLKPATAVAFVALPRELAFLVDAAAFSSETQLESGAHLQGVLGAFDVLIAFFTRSSDYLEAVERLQNAIRRDGVVWICWPKKSSGLQSDLGENSVRSAALQLDLVDIKVAAIDAKWSGLKFMVTRDRRGAAATNSPPARGASKSRRRSR